MRARVLAFLTPLQPVAARAQTQGWGDVGKQVPEGFSWTQPLFSGFWMAWTPATLAFFLFIFGAIACMSVLEAWRPGGAPRRGILGIQTTRGDRLFIGLLGSAFIFLAWIGLVGLILWWPLVVAALWIGFVFRTV